jgi:hypothetical protein
MEALKVSASDVLCEQSAADVYTVKLRLAEAILRHLRRYPDVADTAKGIMQWWLPCLGYENAPEFIDSVLQEMTAKDWLQAIRMFDGEILYRRGNSLEI